MKKKELEQTMMFQFKIDDMSEIKKIIASVYQSLVEKGYNPVSQIVGYLLSGDPAYITSHGDARNMIRKVERDEIMEELVRSYLKDVSGKN
ncbi:MAG: IreB family regulatory phosphoprotein [bacterium]